MNKIDSHAFDQFIKDFYAKLIERLQSSSDIRCTWALIRYSVLPVMYTTANANLGTLTNNRWLIEEILQTLVKSSMELEVKNIWKLRVYQ